MTTLELTLEVNEQIQGYIALCTSHDRTPSVLGFAEHLKESYKEQV